MCVCVGGGSGTSGALCFVSLPVMPTPCVVCVWLFAAATAVRVQPHVLHHGAGRGQGHHWYHAHPGYSARKCPLLFPSTPSPPSPSPPSPSPSRLVTTCPMVAALLFCLWGLCRRDAFPASSPPSYLSLQYGGIHVCLVLRVLCRVVGYVCGHLAVSPRLLT